MIQDGYLNPFFPAELVISRRRPLSMSPSARSRGYQDGRTSSEAIEPPYQLYNPYNMTSLRSKNRVWCLTLPAYAYWIMPWLHVDTDQGMQIIEQRMQMITKQLFLSCSKYPLQSLSTPSLTCFSLGEPPRHVTTIGAATSALLEMPAVRRYRILLDMPLSESAKVKKIQRSSGPPP